MAFNSKHSSKTGATAGTELPGSAQDAYRGTCTRDLAECWIDDDLALRLGLDPDFRDPALLYDRLSESTKPALLSCFQNAVEFSMASCRLEMLDTSGKSAGWFQLSVRVERDAVHLLFVDITAQARRELEIEVREQEFRGIAETVPVGLFRADADGKVIYKNSKLDEVFGQTKNGQPPLERIRAIDDNQRVDKKLKSVLHHCNEGQLDVVLESDGDSSRYVRLRFRSAIGADGQTEVVGSAEDISIEYARQSQLETDALTDPLTGVANRRALEMTLEDLLDSHHEMANFAVLLCDLDGFKQVNDSLGHDAGDAVIAEVGARLEGVCREGDLVARLGGDEFVVLAYNVTSYDEGVEVGERLLPSLRQAFEVDGSTIALSGSVGVAVATSDATVLSLLQMADSAMYEAKRSGRDQVRPYHSPDSTNTLSPLALRRDLRRSIKDNSLDLAFQPIYAVTDTATPVAAEALLRWNHPVNGPIAPSVMIPIAEQSGLIRDCLLYTSPSPRDATLSRMPSSA